MTKFSILSCALIALLALVEVRGESSKVDDSYYSKPKRDAKHVAVQYDIVSFQHVSQYWPFSILFDTINPVNNQVYNRALYGQGPPGYTFIEWAQVLGKISPACTLAPVETLKELYLLKSLIAAREIHDNVLVGVWKDQHLALDCQTYPSPKQCLSDWKTFFGPVPLKPDLWTQKSGYYGREPDGKTFGNKEFLASVAVLDSKSPAMSDVSVQVKTPYAAVKCVIDAHSAFHLPEGFYGGGNYGGHGYGGHGRDGFDNDVAPDVAP